MGAAAVAEVSKRELEALQALYAKADFEVSRDVQFLVIKMSIMTYHQSRLLNKILSYSYIFLRLLNAKYTI